MANETSTQFSDSINSIMESVVKLGQVQAEVATNLINSAASAIEPLAKGSAEVAGNVVDALNQSLQNISAAIAPKK